MKRYKLLPLMLALAIAFGGCNTQNTTESTKDTSETTTETTAEATTTTSAETSAETSETTTEETSAETSAETSETTEANGVFTGEQVMEFDDLKINDYLSVSRKGSFFIPHLLIEGADFDAANKEIDNWAAEFMSDNPEHNLRFAFAQADSSHYSLLIYVETAEYEGLDFKAYTFDVQTKEILDNEKILELAGVPLSEFYDDAYGAVKKILDERGATPDNTYEDEYETSLSAERLNKDMFMFLGRDDQLILGSDVASMGGATRYPELWDLDGNRYSFGCKVDCINFADDFVESFYTSKTKRDNSIALFAHRDDGNMVYLYNYVDGGELVLLDSISDDGSVLYKTYGPTTYIVNEDGSSTDLILDQDGKIKAG